MRSTERILQEETLSFSFFLFLSSFPSLHLTLSLPLSLHLSYLIYACRRSFLSLSFLPFLISLISFVFHLLFRSRLSQHPTPKSRLIPFSALTLGGGQVNLDGGVAARVENLARVDAGHRKRL